MLAANAVAWSPEQWGAFFVIACSSFGAMVVSIVGAVRTRQVRADIRPPSNSATAGALIEAIGQVLHSKIMLDHPEAGVSTPIQVARQLQADAQADPTVDVPPPPERRAPVPPPAA